MNRFFLHAIRSALKEECTTIQFVCLTKAQCHVSKNKVLQLLSKDKTNRVLSVVESDFQVSVNFANQSKMNFIVANK